MLTVHRRCNIGPWTLPCGTPALISTRSEYSLSRFIQRGLSGIKVSKHLERIRFCTGYLLGLCVEPHQTLAYHQAALMKYQSITYFVSTIAKPWTFLGGRLFFILEKLLNHSVYVGRLFRVLQQTALLFVCYLLFIATFLLLLELSIWMAVSIFFRSDLREF